MNNTGLESLSIAELSRHVAKRQLSAREVTVYFLERIARFDGALFGYNHPTPEAALESAAALDNRLDAGEAVGPLAGIPLSIKDVADVAGLPATGASASRRGRVATLDAAVVRRLKDAGAIILGKANCHELAFGGPSFDLPFPPARNPWEPSFFSGGSSSGSGVTVAAGLCLGSLATDTAGSIRLPSTLCGVVGLKPGRGTVPLDGISILAASMDHVGPVAATPGDCRILFHAMRGGDMPPPMETDGSFAGLRIGMPRHEWGVGPRLDQDVRAAWSAAADLVESCGGSVIELDLDTLEDFHAPGTIIMMREVADAHAAAVRQSFSSYGEMFRGRALVGESIRDEDYRAACLMRDRLTARMTTALDQVDALLIPGALAPATPLGKVDKYYFMKDPIPNVVANFTGHPALAFPSGLSRNGMPIGLQILGRMNSEGRLLEIAERFRQTRPEWSPRPPRYFI